MSASHKSQLLYEATFVRTLVTPKYTTIHFNTSMACIFYYLGFLEITIEQNKGFVEWWTLAGTHLN